MCRADCAFTFHFAEGDCKLWPSDGTFKGVESFVCNDWKKRHDDFQKDMTEKALEDPIKYQRNSETKLMRWIGKVESCSMDVQTREISSNQFSTIAAPSCVVSNGKSALYEIYIVSVGGAMHYSLGQKQSGPRLHVGWATFALEQNETGQSDRGVGDSKGSWKVEVQQQVLDPLIAEPVTENTSCVHGLTVRFEDVSASLEGGRLDPSFHRFGRL